MSAKHTTGPWKVRTSVRILPDWHHREILGEDEERCPLVVAEVYSDIDAGQPTEEQAEANANLISAAPELYEALVALDREILFDQPISGTAAAAIELARAAIAKARGGAA